MAKENSYAISTADPSKFVLGQASAARLAALTDLPAEKLQGRVLADIAEEFRYVIDVELLFFRRICGKVVKTDPVTGIDTPVPFATVQVEDTDCSFLGYFPGHSPWSWFFPFWCRREVIGTAQTDACGNFCVWIPRFDIDWILRFRRERQCYGVIFERPTLHDILRGIDPREVPPGIWKGPWPGPDPVIRPDRAQLASRIIDSFGPEVAARITRLQNNVQFGSMTTEGMAALDAPANLSFLRPSLPPELKAIQGSGKKRGGRKDEMAMAGASLAGRIGLDPDDLKGLDLRHYAGPFWRCYDVFVPEWTTVLGVPDITFRVLQDTDGDGVEEQIYGESYFDVRWDAVPGTPVVLHAGPNARARHLCDMPPVPCGNVPAIVMVGRLPVTTDPVIFDHTLGDLSAGYALRVNRPHPSGSFTESLPLPDGQAPLTGVLSLFGCNRTDPSATHYRLMYRYSANHGASFSAPAPFVNMPHFLVRPGSVPLSCSADSLGWFPIVPLETIPWMPQDLLLDWGSGTLASGLYAVTLELGTGGTTVTSHSAEVAIMVDNTGPVGPLLVEVGSTAAGPFTPIDVICPVIRRGVIPQDRFFRVTLTASAQHLKSAEMSAGGCGGGNFEVVAGSVIGGVLAGGTRIEHWHENPDDNDQVLRAIYKLPALGTLEGTYTIGAIVTGRAFSPNDGAGYTAMPLWNYNPDTVQIWPGVAFSVFNANP